VCSVLRVREAMDHNLRVVLCATVLSQLLVDFAIQRDRDVAGQRQSRVLAFIKHGAMHAIGAYLFGGLWFLWQIPVMVLVSHPIIDSLQEALLQRFAPKDATGYPVARWSFWAIVFDQLLHVGLLTAAVGFVGRSGQTALEPYWSDLLGNTFWIKTVVFLSGAVVAVFAGGVLVGVLVQPLLQEIRRAHATNTISPEQRGLENGGKFIGQLERTLIFLFILSAQPAGVGFLVTAKSIFRFGELKDDKTRMEAEYIIIGTMLSFAWAIAVAWITQWALAAI
jgi:hypothetical protein